MVSFNILQIVGIRVELIILLVKRYPNTKEYRIIINNKVLAGSKAIKSQYSKTIVIIIMFIYTFVCIYLKA